MKTPLRELWLHRGLVELVKAPQRLHEGSTKAPRSNHGGAGVSIKWMPHEGIMERSRGLRGASVVTKVSRRLHETFVEPPWLLAAPPWSLRGAFVEPSRSFGATLAPPVIRQIMTGPENEGEMEKVWTRQALGLHYLGIIETVFINRCVI